jgi:L,D-transpeptidase YcbB
MRGLRLGLLFAGTAVAVVLAARSMPAYAATDGNKAIEALVPVPDTALVPPPTARDVAAPAVTPSATTAAPAAAPADQPAATPALASLDQQVSDKLREFLTGKVDRVIERKSRPAVDAFYAARNYAPLWLDNGNANDRAKAVAAFLTKVDADGLNPADYALPDVKPGAEVAALADTELKYTATVLTYARHAQVGRVHFSRISADIAYNLVPPEAADVLGGLIDTNNITGALERFNPPHAGYKALKAKLAEARAAKGADAPTRIGQGPVLKLVAKTPMQDARVPLLRERLHVASDSDSTAYDKAVAEAVRKFQ